MDCNEDMRRATSMFKVWKMAGHFRAQESMNATLGELLAFLWVLRDLWDVVPWCEQVERSLELRSRSATW